MHITNASILGVPVAQATMEQVLNWVEKRIEAGQPPAHLVTANAEIIYRASWDAGLAGLLSKADMITADGAGVVWAGKKIHTPFPERVTGVDLTMGLLALAEKKGWKVYFLGAKPEAVEKAVLRVLSQYPQLEICGYHHGYFPKQEIDQVVSNIYKVEPHLLFVALGVPRQEQFIQENFSQLAVPVSIGVGGTFDVLAGIVNRAPRWMQKWGLEWLYRLLKEPRRFVRILALPRFTWAVWRQSRATRQ